MASRPPEIVPPTPQERARFLIISTVRLSGVVFALLGLLIESGRIDLPRAIGWMLIAAGLAEVFLVPRLLARRWRTPPA